MKKTLLSISLITVLLFALLSACTPAAPAEPVAEEPAAVEEAEPVEEATPAEETTSEEAPAEEGTSDLICGMTMEELDGKISQYMGGYDRPSWTDVEPEETVRIAFLSYQNNPFWVQQKVGFEQAQQEAEEMDLNAQLDFIVVSEKLDPTLMVNAIEAGVVQEYDAMIMFPLNESIVPALDKAVEQDILIGHIATDAPNSPRTVVIGQDLYNAGKMAGYLMIKATSGKGKVGIITGQFGVTPHELRQAGFEEALAECPEMEVVGVVEAHDSADESYAHAQNFMSSNPDLVGLYLTAGGPFGAGRAVEEASKIGEITVIGFDVTEQHVPYVENGSMTTIHQHEPWQSHDNVVFLYNMIVAGTEPTCEACYTPAEIVTKDNVDEWWPAK